MYNKIGIVVDGSQNSSHALGIGIEFCRKHGLTPALIGIMDIVTPMKPYLAIKDVDWVEEISAFRKDFSTNRSFVRKTILEAQRQVQASGVKASTLFLEGQPSERMLEQSKRFDILFLGAFQKSRKRKFEDISGKLARNASCDVFVARRSELKEIILALDGKSLDKDIIEKGLSFARDFSSHMTALHVSEMSSNREKGRMALRKAREAASAAAIKMRAILVGGLVSSKILSYSEKSDLVVIGNKGITGLGDLVLGPISERIARRGQCSVLVVRHAPRRRKI